jgi:hypothetical protein
LEFKGLTEFVENNKQRTCSSRYYFLRYGLDVRRNLFCSPTRKDTNIFVEALISGLGPRIRLISG